MSKSNPTLTNPCSKFIDYSGDTGEFTYYDKEEKKKILVPMPIFFSVLDELSTITGFNEKHGVGIYSNEISNLTKEILRVKTFKGGVSITGLYADIRDNIVAQGGKFTKSVYALLIHEDLTTEFVNFKFKGSSFSAWLDKGFNPMNFIVGVSKTIEETKGKNTYQVPVFKAYKTNPDIDAAAVEQDKILQEYLKVYKAQIPEKEMEHAAVVEESPQLKAGGGFEASDTWRGGGSKSKNPLTDEMPKTKEELMSIARAAMEPKGEGKQPVQSMTDPLELTKLSRGNKEPEDWKMRKEELPQRGEDNSPGFDNPDDLPF